MYERSRTVQCKNYVKTNDLAATVATRHIGLASESISFEFPLQWSLCTTGQTAALRTWVTIRIITERLFVVTFEVFPESMLRFGRYIFCVHLFYSLGNKSLNNLAAVHIHDEQIFVGNEWMIRRTSVNFNFMCYLIGFIKLSCFWTWHIFVLLQIGNTLMMTIYNNNYLMKT